MASHPERMGSPAETLELHSKLRAWARQVESGTSGIVGDLAEIHAAAQRIANSIESLARIPPPNAAESGKILVDLNAWINEELVDHIGSLNSTLADVISRVYEGG